MSVDFNAQTGYNGADSVPDGFSDIALRRWTANRWTNARFGGELRSDGFTGILTIHPVRAMDLLGATSETPQDPFTYDSGQLQLANFEVFIPATPESLDFTVTIHVSSTGADFSGSRQGILLINGFVVADDVFRIGGSNGGTSSQDVPVTHPNLNLWNLLREPDGDMLIQFDPGGAPFGSTFQFDFSYAQAASGNQPFVNKEVAFPHRGVGFLRRGDRFVEPAAIYRPDRDTTEPPGTLSIGQGWVVGGSEPSDVGTPGMTVLGIPFETPPTTEAIFSAYPEVCGVPVPP